jgi:hypothetical protein
MGVNMKRTNIIVAVSVFIFLISFVNVFPQQANELKPPVQLTAEEDHQRLMKLLGIDSLRPGPSGDPSAPNFANIDESKASPYTSLPDPLIFNNGKKVKTAEDWKKRRKEIFEDFDREVYGRIPANIPPVKWEIIKTKNDTIRGIPVIAKELIGHVDNSSYPHIKVGIQLSLFTPAKAKGPVPVIIEFGLISVNSKILMSQNFRRILINGKNKFYRKVGDTQF